MSGRQSVGDASETCSLGGMLVVWTATTDRVGGFLLLRRGERPRSGLREVSGVEAVERESDREGGREEIVSTTWVGGGGGGGGGVWRPAPLG